MLYQLARSALFQFEAEDAHKLALGGLDFAQWSGLLPLVSPSMPEQPVELLGMRFPNCVGLAAGMDKNGDFLDVMATLGFGFVEAGTVTPRPQPGNPQPRLFRIPQANALINRMGFNNKGVDHLVDRLQAWQRSGKKNGCIVGANIGKNFDTPIDRASDDYLICLQKVYAHCDYVTVNVSSPNTKGLRSLQGTTELEQLLSLLKNEQLSLAEQHGKYVPFLVKIAPDLADDELGPICDVLVAQQIDGIIATNTTISRDGVADHQHGSETGGLSGAPLHKRSVDVVRQLRGLLGAKYPIIGVGGITSGEDGQAMLQAGADLVQVYSGFVYRGPSLIREIVEQARTVN